MQSFSQEELEQSLAVWKRALAACATGRQYTIGDRSLTMYDLPEIRRQIEWLERRLASLSGQSITISARPRFRR